MTGDASPVDSGSGGDAGSDAGTASAAQGEYLVKNVLVCGDCHTTPLANGQPDPTKFLAGGRSFIGGLVFSANLTPDKATGLGNWTVEQIKTAILHGMDNKGMPLSPAMPYEELGNLTDVDATSIALYLQSVPAISNMVPMNTLTTPAAPPTYPDSMVPAVTGGTSNPSYTMLARGRYIAEVACLGCHTPDNMTGLDFTKVFAGGRTFQTGPITAVSANLTPAGLVGWTANDIVMTLQTDIPKQVDGGGADGGPDGGPDGGVPLCPPMPGGHGRLGDMTMADQLALANYLLQLPAITNVTAACTGN